MKLDSSVLKVFKERKYALFVGKCSRHCGNLLLWFGNLLGFPPGTKIKLRLPAFVSAVVVIVTAIILTGLTAWHRIGELQERLTAVQMESFRIADHFHQSILDLNNSLLRYQLSPQAGEWDYFLRRSDALNKWIDDQFKRFGSRITPQEVDLLHQLDETYDTYLAAALKLQAPVDAPAAALPPSQPSDALVKFASVKKETDKLLHLGIELAAAHRETLNSFVDGSKRSLNLFRWILLGSLFLLLLCGAGLAIVIYRDLVAPLQVKLVESRILLERQEKLASLGMLAAGVAHEIRNPLTAIKARLYTQQKVLQPGTSEHFDSEVIGHEIDRLERIVKDVLTFARPSDPELVDVPAAQPLQEVAALLSRQFQEANIRLVVEEQHPAFIRIDPQQIKQVLINLTQNAADSIGRDGSITLRSRLDNVRLNERTRRVVVLEVVDSGKGISPEVEKRLFDPFFTTKDTGTGLGLPIAARIVEKHGGVLRYRTRVGRGSTFDIVLPRVRQTSLTAARCP
jgi:signal transduction histidine kinase